MDKFDFMSIVDDIFDECKTKQEMDIRIKEMRQILNQPYLLKLAYKDTMNEFDTKK